MKAIETSGHIDSKGILSLEAPLAVLNKQVKVIILIEEDEIDEQQWLKAINLNDAFDFLEDSGEDIYTIEDGKPSSD
ncbi:MAG: hypothetical protein AAF798_02680 [Bacteroidota bacterium]